MGCRTISALFVVAIGASIVYLCPELYKDLETPILEDQYFGRGPLLTDPTTFPRDDATIKKYKINVDSHTLDDLKSRLSRARFVEPLDNVDFQYGFHSQYLRKVVDYWLNKFDWKKQEAELNKFDHYTTQIEGLNVHFIHQKPIVKDKKVRVIPLLMIHGFPGSVSEFTKILPMLTTQREGRDYVFELICPSIPGYGFSEAPHQKGFSPASAARIFHKLMERLGYKKFYAQGGDWGSVIVSLMSKMYPDRFIGAHVNFLAEHLGVVGWTKYAIGYFFPTLYTTPKEYDNIYPFTKFSKKLLQEMGYALIQGSKPDTVGASLVDSPVGLAAYILEKFSTWTDMENIDDKEGGLTKKFTMDELLTNIMIYWYTNTTVSAMRLYKEHFNGAPQLYDKVPSKVLVGVASFPNELISFPREFHEPFVRHIIRFERMPRGGHFAAMEEPKLVADEVWDFVVDVEKVTKGKSEEKVEGVKSAKTDATKKAKETKPDKKPEVPKPKKVEPTKQEKKEDKVKTNTAGKPKTEDQKKTK